MFERENLKRVNFNVEPTKWEDFKVIAKLNQSDSNKELRKFIDSYLADNRQLTIKIRNASDRK
jgi:hypothetical protein